MCDIFGRRQTKTLTRRLASKRFGGCVSVQFGPRSKVKLPCARSYSKSKVFNEIASGGYDMTASGLYLLYKYRTLSPGKKVYP